jgi:hypothetical protein
MNQFLLNLFFSILLLNILLIFRSSLDNSFNGKSFETTRGKVRNPLEKNINPLEKNMNPLEKNINPLEKNINPLEKNINPLEKKMNPLQKIMNPFEKNMNAYMSTSTVTVPAGALSQSILPEQPHINHHPLLPDFNLEKLINCSQDPLDRTQHGSYGPPR